MNPTALFGEFADSYEEWHYLSVGLAVGFVFGWVVGIAVWSRQTDR